MESAALLVAMAALFLGGRVGSVLQNPNVEHSLPTSPVGPPTLPLFFRVRTLVLFSLCASLAIARVGTCVRAVYAFAYSEEQNNPSN